MKLLLALVGLAAVCVPVRQEAIQRDYGTMPPDERTEDWS